MKTFDTYPIVPVRKYKEVGRRDKVRAFLEWWSDKNADIKKSTRFYAKEWGLSNSTVHEWIKEFKSFESESLGTME